MHRMEIRVRLSFLSAITPHSYGSCSVLELQVVTAALAESFKFSPVKDIEIEQVRVGTNPPMIKGRWSEGAKLPLNLAVRN